MRVAPGYEFNMTEMSVMAAQRVNKPYETITNNIFHEKRVKTQCRITIKNSLSSW